MCEWPGFGRAIHLFWKDRPMADFCIKRIDDIEAIYWGAFKRVRADLGISSFGAQILDLPPDGDGYPEHDHAEDGQEELYVCLRGGGEMDIEGERHPFDPETLISVQSGTKRKVLPGSDGIRILILGAVPGQAYEAPDVTKLGAPDPVAGQPPPGS
jgi:mannose-6-phosphate isomerase-like protein (cupin superfamily)